ncbi:hypothetical protein [Actinoallomurus rhizosphaericola]|uniref:hypothetical protein n=1 Tax=Actinoallomurus rhizosphaericola TaxID=2952536 RepID=UPI002091B59C|nr:hypothetical protein [Actinoallomurus rhizosphaericola]MCO5993225.1 hypothetical protein [Actinoallomurus rhizosphaericola]
MVADRLVAYSQTWVSAGRAMLSVADSLANAADSLVYRVSAAGKCYGQDDIGLAFFNGGSGRPGFRESRDGTLDEIAGMVNQLRSAGRRMIASGGTYQQAERPRGEQVPVPAIEHYKLPPASDALPESDPPPTGGKEILYLLETLGLGVQYPDGNMAALAQLREAFLHAAAEAEKVASEVSRHVQAVKAPNEGVAKELFSLKTDLLTGENGKGGLKRLVADLRGLGGSVDLLIRQKKGARLQFDRMIVFLIATWVIAKLWSGPTLGGSIAGALATTKAAGIALQGLVRAVVDAVVAGVWYGGGMDVIRQTSFMETGAQDHFDTGELFKSIGTGAVAGGVMGAAGGWVGLRGNNITTALSNAMEAPGLKGWGSRFLFSGTAATAGNVAAQAAFDDGHVNLKDAATFGFGMAGIGAFSDIMKRGPRDDGPPPPPGGDGPWSGSGGDGVPRGSGEDGGPPPPPNGLPFEEGGGPRASYSNDGRETPPFSRDGIPNPRDDYNFTSDRGVGYDIQGQVIARDGVPVSGDPGPATGHTGGTGEAQAGGAHPAAPGSGIELAGTGSHPAQTPRPDLPALPGSDGPTTVAGPNHGAPPTAPGTSVVGILNPEPPSLPAQAVPPGTEGSGGQIVPAAPPAPTGGTESGGGPGALPAPAGRPQGTPPATTGGEQQGTPPATTGGQNPSAPPATTGGQSQATPPATTGGQSQGTPPATTGGRDHSAPPATTGGQSQGVSPATTGGQHQGAPAATGDQGQGALPATNGTTVTPVPTGETPLPPPATPAGPEGSGGAVAPKTTAAPAGAGNGGDPALPARGGTPADTPADLARTAVTDGRRIAAPDGLPLQDGGLRVTGPDGRAVDVPAEVLSNAERQLTGRAADGVGPGRLRAEATAWLGGEVARLGGRPRVDGALEALQRMADLHPEFADDVAAVRREVLSGDAARAASVLGRSAEPDTLLRPSAHEPTARSITRQVEALGTDPSKSADPSKSGAPASGAPASRGPRPDGTVPDGSRPSGATHPAGPALPDRPAHMQELSVQEVHRALDDLLPSDFGREVRGWRVADDGRTVVVETEHWGDQRFTVEVRELPHAVTRDPLSQLADFGEHGFAVPPTMMSKEAAVAAGLPPHVVAEEGRRLPQIWQHAVHDRLQSLAARDARSGQGVIRRFMDDVRSAFSGPDRTAEYFTRHRYLAREWLEATDPVVRERLTREIDDLAAEMRDRGRTPPQPPWVSGRDGVLPAEARTAEAGAPAHPAGDPPAPGPGGDGGGVATVTPVAEVRARTHEITAALHRDFEALLERVDYHRAKAQEAGEGADASFREAMKEAGERDSGALERSRKAAAASEKARTLQEYHREMAAAYDKALDRAAEAHDRYEALQRSLERLETGEHPPASATGVSHDDVVALAHDAQEHFTAYQEAHDAALPSEHVLSNGAITGRFPLLHATTERWNEILAHQGSTDRVTPSEVEDQLGAKLRHVLSPQGAELRVRGHKLWVKWEARDLVEVLDDPVSASQNVSGSLPQTGVTAGAALARSLNTPFGLDLSGLAKVMPDHSAVKGVLEHAAPSVGVTVGRNLSEKGSVLVDARYGDVADDRGPKRRFAAKQVVVHVESRDAGTSPGTSVERVTEGVGDDAAELHLYLPHSQTLPPPEHTFQLPPQERGRTPFPEHVTLWSHGPEELLKTTVDGLRAEGHPLSESAQRDLQTAITQKLPGHSYKAANRESGVPDIIFENGRPKLEVQLTKKMVLDSAVPLTKASKDVWQERLRIGVVGVNGSESFNRSIDVSGSLGLKIPGIDSFDAVPGPKDYGLGVGPKVSGGYNRASSDGINMGGNAYFVIVNRATGHEVVMHFKEVVYEARVTVIGENRTLRFTHTGEEVVQAPENELLRHGAPVDAAAVKHDASGEVIRRPDGSVASRDDGDPGVPQGYKAELPAHLGTGKGQVRGAGDALVENVRMGPDAEGDARIHDAIIKELQKDGFLPELDAEGRQIWDPDGDMVEQIGQALTLEQVRDALDPRFVATHYNAASQGALDIPLTHVRSGHAPETRTLTLWKEQDFANARVIETTNDRGEAYLGIGSDTAGRSRAVSSAWEYGGGASLGHDPGQGHAGFAPKVGANHSRNNGHSVGWSEGNTGNAVELHEPTGRQTRWHIPDKSGADLDGKNIITQDGSAEVVISTDLLPRDTGDRPAADPAATGADAERPIPPEVREKVQVQALDLRGGGKDVAAAAGLKPGTTAYNQLSALLHPDNVRSHPEWFAGAPYTVELIVDPHGPSPETISVTLRMRDVTSVGEIVVAPDVDGVIRMNLSSAGSSRSESHSHSTGGSFNGTEHQAGGSTAGGEVDASKGKNTATSTSTLQIGAHEDLKIGLDNKYVHRGSADLEVVVQRGNHKPVTVPLPDRPMLLSIGEVNSLELYAAGTLEHPPALTADAVERVLNGTMHLDRDLAGPLLQRYTKDLADAAKAGAHVPLAEHHTPDVLKAKLESATGLGPSLTKAPAEHLLREQITRAVDLVNEPRRITIPDPWEHSAMVEEMHLKTPSGEEVKLYDAMRRLVEEVAPDALNTDHALKHALYRTFAGKRPYGHFRDAIDFLGHVERIPVQINTSHGVQLLHLRMRAVTGQDHEVLAVRPDQGHIGQKYDYLETGTSETDGKSLGGGVSGSDTDTTGNASTGRSTSVTQSSGEQQTKVNRVAKFGLTKFRQSLTVDLEVERVPLRSGRLVDEAKAPKALTRATVTLDGTVVRWVPTEQAFPVEERPAAGPAQPSAPDRPSVPDHPAVPDGPSDHRPFVPEGAKVYAHEIDGEGPHALMLDAFSELLPAGARPEIEFQLAHQWRATWREAGFEQLTGSGRSITVHYGGQEATARIRLTLVDPSIDVGGLTDVEYGKVWRDQHMSGYAISKGRLFPVTRGFSGNEPMGPVGVSESIATGAQASESVGTSSGLRIETTAMVKGKGVEARAHYVAEITVTHGKKEISRTAHGTVKLTLPDYEYQAARDRQEAPRQEAPAWPMPSDGAPGGADRHWDPVTADPQRPSAPLRQALMKAMLNQTDVRVEVEVPGQESHRYLATKDGMLHCEDEWTDGGFAEAFAGLDRWYSERADEHGVDLRRLFNEWDGEGKFSDHVRDELLGRGVDVPDRDVPRRQAIRPDADARPGSWQGEATGEGAVASGPGGGGV